MIKFEQFSSGIAKNVDRINRYESGGDGTGGGCDCIGLIIGAIRLEGGKWPWTHGSNYAARNRTQNLREIKSTKELSENDIVYKARKPGDAGYSLPDKYKSSGDLNDYYHVGVVTRVNPLKITHCTSVPGGIKVDDTLGQWKYVGWLDQVEKKEKGEEIKMGQYEVVGGPLMLRKGPGKKYAVLKRMPAGSIVSVMDEPQDDWVYVDYQGTYGYCMMKFLQPTVEQSLDEDSIGAALDTEIATIEAAWERLKILLQFM